MAAFHKALEAPDAAERETTHAKSISMAGLV